MTTYFYLDNYRGFKDAYIPICQVNFLVGENSTGKTSFLELLKMFCHPSFWYLEPRFGIHGSRPKHFLDLVSASSKSKIHFTVGAFSIPENTNESYNGMLVTYKNSDGRPVPTRVSIIDNKTIRTVDGRLWISKKGEKFCSRIRKHKELKITESKIERAKTLITAHKTNTRFGNHEITEEHQGTPLFIRCEEAFFEGLNSDERHANVPSQIHTDLVELAPIRSKPRRTYDAPQTEFSPEGDHTPYVIKKYLSNKSQAKEFAEFLEQIGRDSGLFESISIRSFRKEPQSPFEIKIVLGKTALGLDNVGYGVSQALPVIVEMFIRRKTATFTVQQPEVHLHPRAQASIGDLIAELARLEDKCFIVETHSDFMIDRFRLNVRKKGAISSQLLFFERKDSGNMVTPIVIQPDGSLADDQPESYRTFFFNESLSLLA